MAAATTTRAAVGLIISLLVRNVSAAEQVPIKLQVALFVKIFSYDNKLAGRKDYTILVVHGGNAQSADPVVSGFSQAGVRVTAIAAAEVSSKIDNADVVYLIAGVKPKPIATLCRQKGVLSVSGVATHAEEGHVAVSLGLNDKGKPQIIVNMKQIAAEGHQLSAQLLGLARLIQ